MAIGPALPRRAILAAAGALCLPAPGAWAQGAPAGQQDSLRALLGLAVLQDRAATLAASRDVRPEVKDLAQQMAQYRKAQLPRLQAFAAGRGVQGQELTTDQQAVWENLEPLDYLALTRRYAEIQVQALEREIAAYEQARQATNDAELSALATETLPDLRRQLEAARKAYEAVRP